MLAACRVSRLSEDGSMCIRPCCCRWPQRPRASPAIIYQRGVLLPSLLYWFVMGRRSLGLGQRVYCTHCNDDGHRARAAIPSGSIADNALIDAMAQSPPRDMQQIRRGLLCYYRAFTDVLCLQDGPMNAQSFGGALAKDRARSSVALSESRSEARTSEGGNRVSDELTALPSDKHPNHCHDSASSAGESLPHCEGLQHIRLLHPL